MIPAKDHNHLSLPLSLSLQRRPWREVFERWLSCVLCVVVSAQEHPATHPVQLSLATQANSGAVQPTTGTTSNGDWCSQPPPGWFCPALGGKHPSSSSLLPVGASPSSSTPLSNLFSSQAFILDAHQMHLCNGRRKLEPK